MLGQSARVVGVGGGTTSPVRLFYVKSTWYLPELRFDLEVTDGARAWSRSIGEEYISSQLCPTGRDVRDYVESLRSGLITQDFKKFRYNAAVLHGQGDAAGADDNNNNPRRPHLVRAGAAAAAAAAAASASAAGKAYSSSSASTSLEGSFRLEWNMSLGGNAGQMGFSMKGQVVLPLASEKDRGLLIQSMLNLLITSTSELSADNEELKFNAAGARQFREEAQTALSRFQRDQGKREAELFAKFTQVLNTKKKKLREMRDEMESVKAHAASLEGELLDLRDAFHTAQQEGGDSGGSSSRGPAGGGGGSGGFSRSARGGNFRGPADEEDAHGYGGGAPSTLPPSSLGDNFLLGGDTQDLDDGFGPAPSSYQHERFGATDTSNNTLDATFDTSTASSSSHHIGLSDSMELLRETHKPTEQGRAVRRRVVLDDPFAKSKTTSPPGKRPGLTQRYSSTAFADEVEDGFNADDVLAASDGSDDEVARARSTARPNLHRTGRDSDSSSGSGERKRKRGSGSGSGGVTGGSKRYPRKRARPTVDGDSGSMDKDVDNLLDGL